CPGRKLRHRQEDAVRLYRSSTDPRPRLGRAWRAQRIVGGVSGRPRAGGGTVMTHGLAGLPALAKTTVAASNAAATVWYPPGERAGRNERRSQPGVRAGWLWSRHACHLRLDVHGG